MKIRLLYVDDDADDREIFCEAVSGMSEEIECIAVRSCNDALQVVREKQVDIIFLDFRMPEFNGRDCLSKLNEISVTGKRPRVYFYATFMQDFEKENCRNTGAIECFDKPGSAIEIERLVKQVVKYEK